MVKYIVKGPHSANAQILVIWLIFKKLMKKHDFVAMHMWKFHVYWISQTKVWYDFLSVQEQSE